MPLPRRPKQSSATIGVFAAACLLLFGAAALLVLASILRSHCEYGQPVLLSRTVVCTEFAHTAQEWQKGLSDRQSLAARSGMLFVFPDIAQRTFWMKGMRFPLDMIWIADNRVVGWEARIIADGGVRLIQTPLADAVLELNAGDVERLRLQIGDTVRW